MSPSSVNYDNDLAFRNTEVMCSNPTICWDFYSLYPLSGDRFCALDLNIPRLNLPLMRHVPSSITIFFQIFLLKLFSSRGFVPSLVRKGTSIVLITLEEINLRIISSTNYIGGNEYTLAEHYDFPFE